jgi:hypothetical protein
MSEIGARPPFGNNIDQTAAQIVRDIYAHRQNLAATLNGSSSLAANTIVVPSNATLTLASIAPAVAEGTLAATESADTAAFPEHVHDPCTPPAVAEFLLRLCATSKHRESALGDMNERFARDCVNRGFNRARLLYWAEALRSLFPLAGRLLGRALKWAAVVDTIRRFLG